MIEQGSKHSVCTVDCLNDMMKGTVRMLLFTHFPPVLWLGLAVFIHTCLYSSNFVYTNTST